jgi:hypothetical protein
MMDIEEVLKQSLVAVLELESIENKILNKLKDDVNDYEKEPQQLVFDNLRLQHIKSRLKHYEELKKNLNYYIQNPAKIYFPEGIDYG